MIAAMDKMLLFFVYGDSTLVADLRQRVLDMSSSLPTFHEMVIDPAHLGIQVESWHGVFVFQYQRTWIDRLKGLEFLNEVDGVIGTIVECDVAVRESK